MKNLRLTKPWTDSPAVARLQEHLSDYGFEIDIDGIFGPDTDRILRFYQTATGLLVDGICGPITWVKLNQPHGPIVRLRSHDKPRLWSDRRSPRGKITGVTLHQTGCKMPSDPQKWGRVNAHFGILRSGIVVDINPVTDFIWHAQSLSHATIGIEIEGNFEGIKNDPATLWAGGGPVAKLTPEMIAGADILFQFLENRFLEIGSKWETVHAHRQATARRRADPGSEIWQKIAIPWIQNLGIKRRYEGVSEKGLPIPCDWDSEFATGKY